MLKLIFNEDFSHAIMSDNFSQSTIFEITNYSTHQTQMNFNIDTASINNLVFFENKPITKLRIMNSAEELLVNLTFGNDIRLYVLSYNTNLYDGGQSTNVSIGQVSVSVPEENNEGEGE